MLASCSDSIGVDWNDGKSTADPCYLWPKKMGSIWIRSCDDEGDVQVGRCYILLTRLHSPETVCGRNKLEQVIYSCQFGLGPHDQSYFSNLSWPWALSAESSNMRRITTEKEVAFGTRMVILLLESCAHVMGTQHRPMLKVSRILAWTVVYPVWMNLKSLKATKCGEWRLVATIDRGIMFRTSIRGLG